MNITKVTISLTFYIFGLFLKLLVDTVVVNIRIKRILNHNHLLLIKLLFNETGKTDSNHGSSFPV